MAEVPPVSLPYGRGAVEIATAADLIVHRGTQPIENETAAVFEALEHPIGTPPLGQIVKPAESVAVIVNDITRLTRTDLLLPPLIETLNHAGVPDRDIFIVFALGIHRPQTEAERRSVQRIIARKEDCPAEEQPFVPKEENQVRAAADEAAPVRTPAEIDLLDHLQVRLAQPEPPRTWRSRREES